MAKKCQICGKGGMWVGTQKKLRTRYNPTQKRRQKPNLQKVRVPEDIHKKPFKEYAGKKVSMCMKCRKTMLK